MVFSPGMFVGLNSNIITGKQYHTAWFYTSFQIRSTASDQFQPIAVLAAKTHLSIAIARQKMVLLWQYFSADKSIDMT